MSILLARQSVTSRYPLTPAASINTLNHHLVIQWIRDYSNHQPRKLEVLHDNYWPKLVKNPSPFQIFNITNKNSIDKKELKKKYHFFVKLYHPDNNGKFNVSTHDCATNKFLTNDQKLKRFKIITDAYTKLTSDRVIDTSESYDMNRYNHQNWNTRYHHAYYNSEDWGDINGISKKDHTSNEEFNILTFFSCMLGLIMCIKCLALLNELEATLNKPIQLAPHKSMEENLISAYTNYGLDKDKQSRYKRFLWFRTYNIFLNKQSGFSREQFQEEMKKNDILLTELDNKSNSKSNPPP
ncbi:hypothetical protein TPHA_0M01570 [Tetrapisispora phaffii CBS 4417]|uniref:J domain-containing protein n=1 Tax=Tetrapisispora phaffii (strain ATCC 24235 / CBS 4417 / NBRC 1672 / NRRL Y-8282 / UCD 70-5) TaxID=1071381 RepID=G8C0L7_TETPH|nr:hypothetical protein TPHA_0M01570 [Tetrapisispora phaffii CBS 4417]CCE65732.1 hypothetical protein TPHA_0M01570 [Tetrapisispora phaffii CBS 4417]